MQFVCPHVKSYMGKMKLRGSSMILLLLLLTAVAVEAKPDLRESILHGKEPCFRYTRTVLAKRFFYINCSVLHWQSEGYGPDTYISLGANETFDGRESRVDLSGVMDFKGLFEINDAEVTTFSEAPLIKNVHVRNGTLAQWGGFIVRWGQKYFKVDSCSSTGDIAQRAGGIRGFKSGLDNGEIEILNSYSTGNITGETDSGGITGYRVGHNGGLVKITRCYSTGNIEAMGAGGICGDDPGHSSGKVYITQSYFTGDIVFGALGSGGIVGDGAGLYGGYVQIQECYSTGQISARYSGGICGSGGAHSDGEVHIIDCYTRGNIDGDRAGGITGYRAGGCCGDSSEQFGDVHINNTYASGILRGRRSGGIIGHIDSRFQGHTVYIQYSVYNATEQEKIIGEDDENHLEKTGNSNSVDDIRGQLYHNDGIQAWDNDTWVINVTGALPILSFQLMASVPRPSPNPITTRVRILPVQRPPRSVMQHSSQSKRRRTI